MDAVHQFAEREMGKAANGFHQTDVSDLSGRVSDLSVNKNYTLMRGIFCIVQTALVTGGSGGIGFEVARVLALAKARVLILSRKEENAEQAIVKMKESDPAGNAADISFVRCALGNLRDVKAVADRLREQEKRMDLVRYTWLQHSTVY